ncbi:MAG: hypothetical protein A3K19_27435 [Lentisphaerae bacterium RIFOXYB12_FULL_65_16]|nr:MAG: hypothetical protein A3K18_06280 [Lentisphaerae bacterium RIFOXYA12_64_32]OGV86445.1 MAG: hypothetical protein A3K19_27435 [Lentisphaerae bacterium RIFOXYB12_FULL_65_16]
MQAISIDIGSTWTKGARFGVGGGVCRLERRSARPTTVAHLPDAFFSVLGELADGADPVGRVRRGEFVLRYSSSAKGGLAIAALGIVPELTLEMALQTSYSAGGKVEQVYSYRLTRADRARLEANPPDILLFTGGTDGGNVTYNLANAELLGKSALECPIIYAGNRAIADDVTGLLAGKDVRVTENVLPEMERPNPEPAREAIRAIFLERIVKGKGLTEIVEKTGRAPLPTPFAVYEYMKLLASVDGGWNDFCLIDMGGATTDFYSATKDETGFEAVVYKGLREPEVKRTVEGDLGLRVSAESALKAGGDLIERLCADQGCALDALRAHVAKVHANPGHVAATAEEVVCDGVLAGVCVALAAQRHAGRLEKAWTPTGEVSVLHGKDLRRVRRVIGSGGYLAQAARFDPVPFIRRQQIDARGRAVLIPQDAEYFRDAQYLMPLLANIAPDFPAETVRSGIEALERGG